MPTSTYIPLQTITLGSAASSVTFASIPQTYRDLVLVMNYGASNATNSGKAFVNGDTTAANYKSVRMQGNSSSAVSNTNGESIRWEVQATSGLVTTLQFMDYSATDKHKTVLVRANAASTATEASANRWTSTSAITSIAINFLGTDLTTGSTLSLYAIEA